MITGWGEMAACFIPVVADVGLDALAGWDLQEREVRSLLHPLLLIKFLHEPACCQLRSQLPESNRKPISKCLIQVSFYFFPPQTRNAEVGWSPFSSADQQYLVFFQCICCTILNVPIFTFILGSSWLQDGYNFIISNPRQIGGSRRGGHYYLCNS